MNDKNDNLKSFDLGLSQTSELHALKKEIHKASEQEHHWKHCIGTMERRYREYNDLEETYWRSHTLKLADARDAALESATAFDDMRAELHKLMKKIPPEEINIVRGGIYGTQWGITGESWQEPDDRGAWDSMDRWALGDEAWQQKSDRRAWDKARYLATHETRSIISAQNERMERMFSLCRSWEVRYQGITK